ncbi:TylF/MycF/NovP-related O-methyltransferase [Niveispirillum sp. KHB5.9]|uniref:TylF/MycF/NovP-related O-methyltransferase n=1 Tax=Niveispirillum sp. KHB5.9 TaxID=3400269 RepID=UPI003A844082
MDLATLVEEFNRAVALHQEGRLEEAESVYTRLIEAKSDIPWSHYYLGLLRLARGDTEQGLAGMRRGLELAPDDAEIRRNLIQSLTTAGRLHEAQDVLNAGAQVHGYRGRAPLEQHLRLMVAQQGSLPAPKAPPPLPEEQDDMFDRIVARAWPNSMNATYGMIEAFHSLYSMVKYVSRYRIPGDFVECGVYAGGMSLLAALTLIECGDTDRHLYLYDTYEGMPAPTPEDGEQMMAAYEHNTKDGQPWAKWGIEAVRRTMLDSGYPADRIHLVKGMVEDTIPATGPGQIAILRLDTDFYSSIRHVLQEFYPRLSRGGGLVIDDYGYMPGARLAVDEYFADADRPLLLNRVTVSVRAGVKI